MKTFFVYQNWTTEKLYKSGLTEMAAYYAAAELDSLIKNGHGNGCACVGNIADESDYHVAKRLGLI